MMKSIVKENKVTFKELEQEIFRKACRYGVLLTQIILEEMDRELHEGRDKKKYRDKGLRRTTIKTVYGEVEYSRHVYRTTDEEGHRAYVYLLDAEMGMEKIGLISTNLAEKIAVCAAEEPYRKAAGSITGTCGQSVSAGGVWNVVQKLGGKISEEEEKQVRQMEGDVPEGRREIKVLFEEMDGVWLKMQGKGHKKLPKQEMKVSVIYEGWKKDGGNRSSLCGKKVLAGMEKSGSFHAKREAQIRSIYNADEIEYRILNGDGGSWIKDPYEPEAVYQLDRFHIMQAIKKKLNKDKKAAVDVEELFAEGKMEEMLQYILIYAESVETDDPEDVRSSKARELYDYLYRNREGLVPYRERGLALPELPEGMRYGNMGVQENQNCTVITGRMKGRRMRWSEKGADSMAKVLYRKENKELAGTVERYAEKLFPDVMLEEGIRTLSAAKAPKKDGKGSPYAEKIRCHMPLRDAVQTASRKAFLEVFA